MKLKHLFLGALATLAIASCQQPQPEVVPDVKVSKAELTAVAAGEDLVVQVAANVDWTAHSDSDWAVVSPSSGKTSELKQDLTIKVAENTAETAREATITVKAGPASATVKVTQAAKEPEQPQEPEDPQEPEKPEEPEAKTYILVGEAIGGWDVDKNGKVLTLADGYYQLKGVDILGNKGMHFTLNNKWEGNIKGKEGLIRPNTIGEVGGNDISLTESGKYDVYLTEALDRFYFMSEGKLPSEATEHVPMEVTYGVCGAIEGNSWGASADIVLEAEGEWLVAKGVNFTEVNFKVRGNNSWADDHKWGCAEKDQKCALNEAIAVSTCTEFKSANADAGDNPNIFIGGAGTYDVYFSAEKKQVYVMEQGYEPGDTPIKPYDLKDGAYWIMASHDQTMQVMTPLAADKDYGYPTTVAAEGGASYAANAFTFTKVEGGYTIQDDSGRYYYHNPAYNSFNAGAELPAEGGVWEVFENINGDGTFAIINTKTESVIGYSTQYKSYGVYTEEKFEGNLLPVIVPAENPIAEGVTWGEAQFAALYNQYGSSEVTEDFSCEKLYFSAGGGKFKFGQNNNAAGNKAHRFQFGGKGDYEKGKQIVTFYVDGPGTLKVEAISSGDAARPLMVAVDGVLTNEAGYETPDKTQTPVVIPVECANAKSGSEIAIWSGNSGINVFSINWVGSNVIEKPDTPAEPEADKYDVIGCIVDNFWQTGVQMVQEGEWYVAKGIKFAAESDLNAESTLDKVKFLIRKNESNDNKYGYGTAETCLTFDKEETAVAGGSDFYLKVGGTFDVYFNPATLKVYVMTSRVNFGDEVVAQWWFDKEKGEEYGKTFGKGLDAGYVTKVAGDNGQYIDANAQGTGKITFNQIDKTGFSGYSNESKCPQYIVGSTGHPYVTGIRVGDYWTISAGGDKTYAAGTKVRVNFLTRTSGSAPRYWKLEYLDGSEWKPVYEMQTTTYGEETVNYNFSMVTEDIGKDNILVDEVVTLVNQSQIQFRMTCVHQVRTAKDQVDEVPVTGTCRFAGTAASSPVISIVK